VTDQRVSVTEFDVEVDRKTQKRLADMGINKPDDLGPGRMDLGQIANQLGGVDADVSPLIAEKVVRDRQFAEMAGGQEQPTVTPAEEPAQEQAQQAQAPTIEQRLEAAEKQAAEWKNRLGRQGGQLGEERRATAERIAKLEEQVARGGGQATVQQNPQYAQNPVGNVDPNEPMTGAQTQAMMLNMATAWGQHLEQRDQIAYNNMRQLQGYTVTVDQEADLLENHTWLTNLDRASQMKAMSALVKPVEEAKTGGVAQADPRANALRAQHIATTTFIEPSAMGSDQEKATFGGADPELLKKAQRLKELLRTKGGSDSGEAERLMNDLAGRRR